MKYKQQIIIGKQTIQNLLQKRNSKLKADALLSNFLSVMKIIHDKQYPVNNVHLKFIKTANTH